MNTLLTDLMSFFNRDYFSNRPIIGFWSRLLLVFVFLALAIRAENINILAAGFAGCIIFRLLCRRTIRGFGLEIRSSAFFTILVVVLALPTYTESLLEFAITTFLKFFLFFAPSVSFAASLYPREGAYALQRLVPAELLLSVELALRFLPLLAHEAFEVFALQKARKALRSGPVSSRVKALALPFFVRLFRISDRVSYALHHRKIHSVGNRIIVSPERVIECITHLETQDEKNGKH